MGSITKNDSRAFHFNTIIETKMYTRHMQHSINIQTYHEHLLSPLRDPPFRVAFTLISNFQDFGPYF